MQEARAARKDQRHTDESGGVVWLYHCVGRHGHGSGAAATLAPWVIIHLV
ncbi:MAG: hypothetical protein AAGU75_11010 [Bacillota bacterium]